MGKFRSDDVVGYTAKKKYKKRYNRKKPVSRSEVRAIAKAVVEAKPERKNYDYVDLSQIIYPYNTNPWVLDLTEVTQGSTDTTRVGNEITFEYLGIRALLRYNPSASVESFNARVLVFQWYPDTAVDTPTNVSILASTNYIQGYFNRENSGQYKVLFDQRMVMQNDSASPNAEHLIDIAIPKSTKGLRKTLHFNDANTTGTNHIFMTVLCDTADGVDGPLMDHTYSRFIFTDM